MPIIKLKKEKDPNNEFDLTEVTMTIEADDLNDICESFRRFLLACGFIQQGVDQAFGIYENEIPPPYEEEIL